MNVVQLVSPGEGVAVCKVHQVLVVWELHCEGEGVVGLLLAAHNVVGAISYTRPTAHPASTLHRTRSIMQVRCRQLLQECPSYCFSGLAACCAQRCRQAVLIPVPIAVMAVETPPSPNTHTLLHERASNQQLSVNTYSSVRTLLRICFSECSSGSMPMLYVLSSLRRLMMLKRYALPARVLDRAKKNHCVWPSVLMSGCSTKSYSNSVTCSHAYTEGQAC